MEHDTTQQELANARQQLEILYEISNAMRTTLKLDEILYIILTGVTAHAGLGFNRAMLLLINERTKQLEGAMGIGPDSGEEAQAIWRALDPARTTLDHLIAAYRSFRSTTGTRSSSSKLDQLVGALRIPLRPEASVLARAAVEGTPFEVLTEEARAQLHDPFLDSLELDRFVVVPLRARARVVGVLVADNRFTGKSITQDEVRLLMMCATQAGLAIENSRLYERTLLMANTDSLTQLWNHATFQHLLDEELARAARSSKELSMAMLDLDDFKRYNDTAGHQAGDRLLMQMAQILRDVARNTDQVARYGGEEFAIIFPETTKSEAYQACERIRTRLAEEGGGGSGAGMIPPPASRPGGPNSPPPADSAGGGMTVSIGVATFPHDADTKDRLIYAADMALLAAKRSGKNQTLTFASQK